MPCEVDELPKKEKPTEAPITKIDIDDEDLDEVRKGLITLSKNNKKPAKMQLICAYLNLI